MLWLLIGLSLTVPNSAQVVGSPFTTEESCQEAAAVMQSDWLRLKTANDLEPGTMWAGCIQLPDCDVIQPLDTPYDRTCAFRRR